mgnify:FL=1
MKGKINKTLVVFIAFCLAGLYIIFTAAQIMFTKSGYWNAVKDKFTADSLSILAMRGNILSHDGKVMVATLPEYRILMDYVVIDKDSVARCKAQHWRDSAYTEDLDSIVTGLAEIFPDKTPEYFRDRLERGRKKGSHAWRIYEGRATYIQYMACKKLPLFRESSLKGGFHVESTMQRKKLYGSLASRTLGDVYRDSDAAKSGLEWCFDTLLRGRPGICHRTKVRKKWLDFVDLEPVNGHDLVSTIDVRMQDIAEKALVDKLKELGAEKGVVILMEVATGDIRAMVSMTHVKDSTSGTNGYYEIQNDAINALWEPGSTFKTGSIMVAMEDGYITPETIVDCEGGLCHMHGRDMKDHNWVKGGYGDLTVTQILGQSSNIGVSKIIDKYYHEKPEKYFQGLYNIGVGIPLNMPMGADPVVKMRKNWSKTDLAWTSIGYVSQIAPISTLAFYNAIANNGKMVRPRFVRAELDNGRVVREFPVEVIKERICSDKTLHNIQNILEKVVSEGLGKKAGNKKFRVSGKTGTAQVAENGSYAAHKYMVSFCGYFPSEAPKYSCIVCIYKRGLPASGGVHCGPVFSQISQLVMNQGEGLPAKAASDSTSSFIPMVASGNLNETRNLLQMMKMPWQENNSGNNVWGNIQYDTISHKLRLIPGNRSTGTVPNVKGMGARDAVFALQSAGLRVCLHGTGTVKEQSIPAGTKNAEGRTITINLK